MPVQVIRSGDCVRSLAKKHGFSLDAIWQHPDNTPLRQLRKDPHVLAEGDKVVIPDPTPGTESAATDQRHRFVVQTLSAKLRIRLISGEEPLRDTSYTLDIDGAGFSGVTDADGVLEHTIPADAAVGCLHLEDFGSFELKLGALEPIDTVTGVQQRLSNLGYICGPIDGICGDRTRAAVIAWQAAHGLEVDGVIGPETKNSLETEYGC